jgi:hypothetical protein
VDQHEQEQKQITEEQNKNYSTEYSHVVPHHSTDSAINSLTAQIGRDAVLFVVYGRNSKVTLLALILTPRDTKKSRRHGSKQRPPQNPKPKKQNPPT